MANSPSGDSVINRVARILAAFTAEQPALTLRELASMAQLPLSTTHRLAAELEVEGLLNRDGTGRLCAGTRLWELASQGSRVTTLREAALPPMEDAVAETGQHISGSSESRV